MIFLQAYKYYLIKISTLLGAPLVEARQQAEELIDFEAGLAQVSHYKYTFLFL
jgi:hypothetical protein